MSMLGENADASPQKHSPFVQERAPEMGVSSGRWRKAIFLESVFFFTFVVWWLNMLLSSVPLK